MIEESVKSAVTAEGRVEVHRISLACTGLDAVAAKIFFQDTSPGFEYVVRRQTVDGVNITIRITGFGSGSVFRLDVTPYVETHLGELENPLYARALRLQVNETKQRITGKVNELKSLITSIKAVHAAGELVFADDKASETRAIAEKALNTAKRLEERMGDMARRLALSDEDSE